LATETPIIENVSTPNLGFDPYSAGAAGSHFLLLGAGFIPTEILTLSINKQPLPDSIEVEEGGSFALAIASSDVIETGAYTITITEYPDLAIAFVVAPAFPVREPIAASNLAVYPLRKEIDDDADSSDINDPSTSGEEAGRQNRTLYFPFTQHR